MINFLSQCVISSMVTHSNMATSAKTYDTIIKVVKVLKLPQKWFKIFCGLVFSLPRKRKH